MIDEPTRRLDEGAPQEALMEALRVWPEHPPRDPRAWLGVLHLVCTTGHAGRVNLAGEAIRLARQLTLATAEPEARGLLALMLLNHARHPAPRRGARARGRSRPRPRRRRRAARDRPAA